MKYEDIVRVIDNLTEEQIELEKRAITFRSELAALCDKYEISDSIPSWILANYIYDSLGVFMLNNNRLENSKIKNDK